MGHMICWHTKHWPQWTGPIKKRCCDAEIQHHTRSFQKHTYKGRTPFDRCSQRLDNKYVRLTSSVDGGLLKWRFQTTYLQWSKKSRGSVFSCSWKRSRSSSILSSRLLDWSSKVWICALVWSWLWLWSDPGCPMVTSCSGNAGPGEFISCPHSNERDRIRFPRL